MRQAFLILLLVIITGCGYSVGFRKPEILKGKKTVCVVAVKNPTTNLKLGATLRAFLRDEFTKRLGLSWTSCKKADILFYVDILSYSDITKVESEKERTLKSELELKISVRAVDGDTEEEIWKASGISARESYTTQNKSRAETEVIRDVVERLVERMTGEF